MAEIVYEHEVAGQRVTLKKRLPGKDAHLLPKLLLEYNGDTDIIAAMGMIAIESWGFDGDPSKKSGYANLDIFDELGPLGRCLIEYITARMAAARPTEDELKN